MKKDYSYDELYPGRFIKAADFKGRDVTLTISDVDMDELEDQKGKKMKCVLTFREVKKQLVLVKTNGECVKGMFGPKVREWLGKRVTFFPEDGTFFGRRQQAVRVRGSPDIAKDMTFFCKVGRDDPFEVTMVKTGQKPTPAPTPAPAPAPEPGPDVDEGELRAPADTSARRSRRMPPIVSDEESDL